MKEGGVVTVRNLVIGLVVVLIGLYAYVNSVRSQGISMETSLNAQYLDNQNELSAYKASFYEQIGVANLKSDKMDRIIEDAVKGRYDGTLQRPGSGGAFFSAIHEAYPAVSGLNLYDKVRDHVQSGREAYKQKQTKLLDMLRAYDNWRRQGLVRSGLVRFLGFPSEALEARIGTTVHRGQVGLDQMWLIVLTSDAKRSYETGVDEPARASQVK